MVVSSGFTSDRHCTRGGGGGDNVSLYGIDLKRMLLLPNCSQPYSEKLILNAWGAVNEENQSWLKKWEQKAESAQP